MTEAKIRLERHVDVQGAPSERVLELAYLNSFFETGLRSPLDEAILAHQHIDVSAWKKIDEVPFDFERRRVSVLLDNGKSRLLVVKGAPDDILSLCTICEQGEVEPRCPMDKAVRAGVRNRYHALEREGFRVIGIAWREVGRDHPHAVVSDESELVLAGFAAFLDPPKESASAALAALKASGVDIKIVTGDSELVTHHICGQLNIPVTGTLTGKDVAQMDDHALRVRVATANLFCRVNPSQKERIIIALKAHGHVVGYLGDGINDAPALHSADVGLSVDSAVDVAKEAADIILLEPDLHVLHDGVLEGRRTFCNIMKYIMMGTSSNFGNMFSMAGASLFLPFLPMLPTQILLNNILYDVSEVAIPLDEVDAEEVRRPRVLDMKFIRNFMLVVGPISSIFDFLTFYVLLSILKADEALFQTGWFVESLTTQVLVIFIIRTRGNPLASRAASGANGNVHRRRHYRRGTSLYAARYILRLPAATRKVLSSFSQRWWLFISSSWRPQSGASIVGSPRVMLMLARRTPIADDVRVAWTCLRFSWAKYQEVLIRKERMLFIDRVACLVEFGSYPVRRNARVFGRALRRLHAEIDDCEPAARL